MDRSFFFLSTRKFYEVQTFNCPWSSKLYRPSILRCTHPGRPPLRAFSPSYAYAKRPPTAAAAAVFLLRSSLLKQTTGPPSSPHPVHPSLLGCAPRVALYAGEALSPPHRADFPFCGCAGIIRKEEEDMPLGLILSSLGRSMRRKRLSSLGILSSKRAPRDYYKGKNCKPTGFHTRKGNALRDALWSDSSRLYCSSMLSLCIIAYKIATRFCLAEKFCDFEPDSLIKPNVDGEWNGDSC